MLVPGVTFSASGRVVALIGSNPPVAYINQGFGFSVANELCIDTDSPPLGNSFCKGYSINPSGAVYGSDQQTVDDVHSEGIRMSPEGQLVFEQSDPQVFHSGNPLMATGNFSVT
jgi:hypothetical protein